MKEIRIIEKEEKENFKQMFTTYLDELSLYDDSLKDEKKRKYIFKEVESYWDSEQKLAIKFLVENKIVGFSLLKELNKGIYEITEFYVVPEARKDDNALEFAFDIVEGLKGKINISTNLHNERAKSFWTKFASHFDKNESFEKDGFMHWVVDTTEKEEDTRTFYEKLEDGVDNVFGSFQDFFYGERHNIKEDIPATMELPSGRRKILKFQTRRNINRKLFHNKRTLKIVLIILGFVLCAAGIGSLLMFLLTM